MPITRTITIEKKKTRRTRQVAFKRTPNPKGKQLVVVESPACLLYTSDAAAE